MTAYCSGDASFKWILNVKTPVSLISLGDQILTVTIDGSNM
jgi:hypothetical protein